LNIFFTLIYVIANNIVIKLDLRGQFCSNV